jgi:hypothetical protein
MELGELCLLRRLWGKWTQRIYAPLSPRNCLGEVRRREKQLCCFALHPQNRAHLSPSVFHLMNPEEGPPKKARKQKAKGQLCAGCSSYTCIVGPCTL